MVDIDVPEPQPRDKKRRFDFFEKEVIAPVEENPLSAIDEDLASFDGLGDMDDLDPL